MLEVKKNDEVLLMDEVRVEMEVKSMSKVRQFIGVIK